jgi:hypothetical protein
MLRSVLPTEGAVDVPPTIELRIAYGGAPALEPNAGAVLETDDGTAVPTSWERVRTQGGYGWSSDQLWVGHPAAPLAASTHYRLRHLYRACSETDAGTSSYCDGLCVDAAGEVISEFTTGTAVDPKPLVAPTFGVPVKSVDTCDASGCCGPYVRCIFSVQVSALPAGQQLRVTKGDELVGYFSGLRVGVPHSGRGYDNGVEFSGAGAYQVVVTDGTSNRSPAATLVIPACTIEGSAPDAARPAPPDASTSVDTGSPDAAITRPETSSDDGCALADPRAPWTWLALAVVLARRRARRA